MKLPIQIEYTTGDVATYVAAPPEWAKWEKSTGFKISQAQEKIGVSDLMFLAYAAMKREAAGKPVKPYEAWCETIAEIVVGDGSPKATNADQSAGS
jgi:hypothetical protein